MASDDEEQDPIDQLVDLFVYAPIGLLYEYDEVMDRLVKRGKSQVQLARVVGQLAVSGRRAAGDATDMAEVATTVVSRVATEIGSLLGLAAEPSAQDDPPPPRGAGPPEDPPPSAPAELAEAPAVPIANYDDLKAKEIIPLLASLTADQRSVVRSHEEDHRARKTVLAKLDRLDA
ncbi:MAG: hypothetical protein ACR2QO_22470 [Acidimicrobiales bacterium]